MSASEARFGARPVAVSEASAVKFDDDILSGLRNDLQLQSPGYEDATERYDIEISGNANMVTISSI